MINGERTIDELEGRVLRLESKVNESSGLIANLKGIVRNLQDQAARIEATVNEIHEWKEDTKVTAINSLRAQVKTLQGREERRLNEAERDRLDRNRSIRAAVITAIGTLATAYVAHKLGVPVP